MRCQEFYNLFSFKEYVDVWEVGTQQKIAAHICTCTSCSQGITQLSRAVMAEDVLTCDVCCASLPGYYEATALGTPSWNASRGRDCANSDTSWVLRDLRRGI